MSIHQEISSSFLNKFQLSSEDLLILNENKKSLSLTHSTFSVLDRIQKVHSNSKVLMQSGLQTLALDTMEQMVFHQVSVIFFTYYNIIDYIFLFTSSYKENLRYR